MLNVYWVTQIEFPLGSDIRKLVVEGRNTAIKLRLTMNIFQRENKTAKENTTTKVGEKGSNNLKWRGSEGQYYQVKSIISPGIKKGLSFIFNFFFGRLSLLSF